MSSEPGAKTAEVVIQGRSLGKSYHIYTAPQNRLWQMLWPGRRQFYHDFPALQGVDIEVRRGETVGIVGRNGSGKSTLLQLICGTLDPTAGELEVTGSIAPLLSLGPAFNPEFTGRENARLNATILGVPAAEIEDRLVSIIDFADIGEFFDQPVRSYSSGMNSRLAFAVAIHSDPDILVVDEVLAVGDEAFNRKCFARIEELKSRGTSILFVSHAANIVVQLCDRALLLEAGRRLLTGEPKTVIAQYKRLLYAPKSERAEVVREIEQLDGVAPPPAGTAPERTAPVEIEGADDSQPVRFDPNLVPKSTTEFVRKGAEIDDARILDRAGNPVNILRVDQSYTFSYRVRFLRPAERVRFGMMLKLRTGFELGGQISHTESEGIEQFAAGAVVRPRFQFQPSLSPGAYFLNAGVLGRGEDGEEYLCRVLDVIMFRIEPYARDRITGHVDLTPRQLAGTGFELEFLDD